MKYTSPTRIMKDVGRGILIPQSNSYRHERVHAEFTESGVMLATLQSKWLLLFARNCLCSKMLKQVFCSLCTNNVLAQGVVASRYGILVLTSGVHSGQVLH
ncbi:uncharacterized protein LOC120290253 [Eucalyptus grandis]|uniref:uncharacterized protein LOC120290253 n=1 Tax=Eucalyptus grandis TaxID=71139 RepID=UPI00192EC916|nr:uncharacterized protein LOC120290253 [Eucalyptus grandis]